MEQEKRRSKADTLAYLRSQIQKMEGFKPESQRNAIFFDIPEIDSAFPSGSFPLGAIHEFICSGQENTAATVGFSSSVCSKIAQNDGAILWLTKSGSIYPPGLRQYGIKPERIIFVELRHDQEALWAMEEGLRTKGLAVVIAEIQEADLTATRRLQLAVEESGVTGFLIRVDARKKASSSCFTSWEIRPMPSQFDDGMPGVGFPRWQVELLKVRNGKPNKWQVEWKAGKFHLVKKQQKEIQRDHRYIKVVG